jgi:carbamoyltransferase
VIRDSGAAWTTRHIHRVTGERYLCLAGGVALNCVGNGRILRESPFDDIWIQPAAGDAGGALGAALFTWYQYLGNQRVVNGSRDSQKGSFLGPEYSNQEIKVFLDSHGINYSEIPYAQVPRTVAEFITQEKVVGWFEGRMEFGPRRYGGASFGMVMERIQRNPKSSGAV